MVGCIPQKQTRYLQDLSQDKEYSNPFDSLPGITDRYVLQPNDYLYIQIRTLDEKISEFFNAGSGSSSGQQSLTSRFITYMIDDSMNVDFPYVGKINLSGCNLPMAKERIVKMFHV